MGLGSPGHALGGLRHHEDEAEARGHVHCWLQCPGSKDIFSGLRRPGVDVEIELSVVLLINDRRALYTSAQDVALIPGTVDVEFSQSVSALPTEASDGSCKPGRRIYRPINNAIRPQWPLDHIECYNCHCKWRLGIYACLCYWVPMTFRAFHDVVFMIDDVKTREDEVWEHFRMAMREFEKRCEATNSELRPIRLRSGAVGPHSRPTVFRSVARLVESEQASLPRVSNEPKLPGLEHKR